MATRREWVGGSFPVPGHVTGDGEPYRPNCYVWLQVSDGCVVGFDVPDPAQENGALGRTLEQAMREPLVGLPRRPTQIRVAHADLAAEAKAIVGDMIPLVIGATPELDQVAESMYQAALERADGDVDPDCEQPSYLEAGRVQATTVADLFLTAKVLRRLALWDVVDERQLLRCDIDELDVDGACVSIVKELGDEMGLVIFPSRSGLEEFVKAISAAGPAASRKKFGTTWRSLRLVPVESLPASMRREAIDHGWAAEDETLFPVVEHHDRDGLPRPLTERDVRIVGECASALTTFFVTNRRAFEEPDPEPVCQSITTGQDVTVRFTLPYEAFSLFDVGAEPMASVAAPTPRVGRNEACPCGSGKKYKKCHLGEDGERASLQKRAAEFAEVDGSMVWAMSEFATKRFAEELSVSQDVFGHHAHVAQLSVSWLVHHREVGGRLIRNWFRDEEADTLNSDEQEWMVAQDETWLSVWEVIDVQPGSSVTLEDHLTGEVRLVQEKRASRSLARRDSVLARITSYRGLSFVCGVHPRPLPPLEAAAVVQRMRSHLRRKRAVPPDRLQGERPTTYLIRRWEQAVEAFDRRFSTPPELVNTDGDPLRLTVDHFELEPGDRGEIESRLAALDDVDAPDPGEEDPAFRFHRTRDEPGPPLQAVLIGAARLSDGGLSLETNSTRRADALRRRVEAACGRLIRRKRREYPKATQPDVPAQSPPEASPELQQLGLDFKKQHYATWSDHPLPALQGRTAREAVQSRDGREAVDVLLKDMEHSEQRMPAASRFDFSKLRRELGFKS